MPAATTEYTATWTQTLRQYALNVAAGTNGTVSGGGTYDYGTNVNITATPNTNYHFVQWQDGNIANPRTITVDETTPDVTYTATFAPNVTYYTLSISAGSNGSVNTAVNGQKEEGTQVDIVATADMFYAFVEWSDGNTDNPRTVTMNDNVTLTASFAIANPMALSDNETASYYSAYDALADETGVNVQLMRTFKSNTWSTVCLPFSIDLQESGNEAYDGAFFTFQGASGDYTGLTLYFVPAGSVEANTPYLYRSASGDVNPVFHNVTLSARAAGSAGATEIGNVRFQGTIEPATINDDVNHTLLVLNNNRIYYPNHNGTHINAFRGYFLVGGLPAGVQPRVRIVVEDQNATAIETIEMDEAAVQESVEVRKYIENGILIIERNGVRYNAAGGVIDN
jgi:hypothetical protein